MSVIAIGSCGEFTVTKLKMCFFFFLFVFGFGFLIFNFHLSTLFGQCFQCCWCPGANLGSFFSEAIIRAFNTISDNRFRIYLLLTFAFILNSNRLFTCLVERFATNNQNTSLSVKVAAPMIVDVALCSRRSSFISTLLFETIVAFTSTKDGVATSP